MVGIQSAYTRVTHPADGHEVGMKHDEVVNLLDKFSVIFLVRDFLYSKCLQMFAIMLFATFEMGTMNHGRKQWEYII